MENWTYVDDAVLEKNTEQIHVDTRDFYLIQSSEPLNVRDGKYPEISKAAYDENYLIDREYILTFIKNLETITGGKGSWRMMSFYGIEDAGWFKYVRLYKINKGKNKGKFVVCSRDTSPVKWREMTKENLKGEYLNYDNS